MNVTIQAPPTDLVGMTDRLMSVMPILIAGFAVLGLAIWLYMKWRDARDFQTYVDVVSDVRKSGGARLSDEEVHAKAFPKYLEAMDAKTMPGRRTKGKS
jgi:hypothetical protein